MSFHIDLSLGPLLTRSDSEKGYHAKEKKAMGPTDRQTDNNNMIMNQEEIIK